MKHRHTTFAALPLVILLLLALNTALALSWTAYRSSLGFSLRYPNGWQVNATKSDVQFRALNREGLTLAEFGVGVRQARTLEDWVKVRKQETTLPDGSNAVESVRDTRLAGRPAKRIVVFSFDRSIAEEAVLAGGRLYVVSYDHVNPNDPNFKAHAAIYKAMRDSLRF